MTSAPKTPAIPSDDLVPVTLATGRNALHVRTVQCEWNLGQFKKPFVDNETVLNSFISLCQAGPGRNLFGIRKPLPGSDNKAFEPTFTWQTRAEVLQKVLKISEFLKNFGPVLAPRAGRVGILASNRPEWLMAQYACYYRALIPIPLYATLGPKAMLYTVGHSEIAALFCSGVAIASITDALVGHTDANEVDYALSNLKSIIVFDRIPIPDSLNELLAKRNIRISFFDEIISETSPALPDSDIIFPTPDDDYIILYTSGTSGKPKGVIIKHRMAAHSIDALLSGHQWKGKPIEGETYLSFLPLAHALEQDVCNSMIHGGVSVGFLSGPITSLFEDIGILKPVIITTVPRLWKRFQDQVVSVIGSSSFIARSVFNIALSSKLSSRHTNQPTWINWDSLVLHKIADKLGGRMRFILCGGAALDFNLDNWIQATTNVPIFQGYGLTETFGCCLIQNYADEQHQGHECSYAGCQVLLADVPEMGRLSKNGTGEILIKGIKVTPGYLKDPEQTIAAFEDGWFCTGDIGELQFDGAIRIVDRRKNIFKLSQGEYVAVEYLENCYTKADGVAQIWLHGTSNDSFLTAIICPNIPQLRHMVGEKESEKLATDAQLCENPAAKRLVLQSINKVAKELKLQGFEIPKAIYLESNPWTPESDLLTPTLKIKRIPLAVKYKEILEKLRSDYEKQQNSSTTPSSSAAQSTTSKK